MGLLHLTTFFSTHFAVPGSLINKKVGLSLVLPLGGGGGGELESNPERGIHTPVATHSPPSLHFPRVSSPIQGFSGTLEKHYNLPGMGI